MATDPRKTMIAFGYHDSEGSRHWVIKQGLRTHGFQVIECQTKQRGLFPKYKELSRKYRQMHTQADYILVPFLGHYMVSLAWLLSRFSQKTIIFDCFISLYDTDIVDRKRFSPWHPRAWLSLCIDWLSCSLANIVLIDTEEHKQYLIDRYRIQPHKIIVVPIGCRTDIFKAHPARERSERFEVEFHGMFIPLQGIETILRAAHVLQQKKGDVHFKIIGKGQTFSAIKKLAETLNLTNVTFTGHQTIEEVASAVQTSDVCLGIFGETPKAARVIPHKAYEVIASGRALITGDTPAARRVFRDQENVLLSKPGKADDLAHKIMLLREDTVLRDKIANGGYRLFHEQFESQMVVSPLVEKIM